jgi:hypothetical protein
MISPEAGYCPRCRALRNLTAMVKVGRETSGGRELRIRRRELYCATCNMFVSASEEPLALTVITSRP